MFLDIFSSVKMTDLTMFFTSLAKKLDDDDDDGDLWSVDMSTVQQHAHYAFTTISKKERKKKKKKKKISLVHSLNKSIFLKTAHGVQLFLNQVVNNLGHPKLIEYMVSVF